jgi:hypothetical protein
MCCFGGNGGPGVGRAVAGAGNPGQHNTLGLKTFASTLNCLEAHVSANSATSPTDAAGLQFAIMELDMHAPVVNVVLRLA